MSKPSLITSKQHALRCHERWKKRLNRAQGPTYRDEWYAEQCGACRFFIPLMGALAEDYGCCSNETSPFDGKAMFEHDGCEQFEEGGDWGPVGEEPEK